MQTHTHIHTIECILSAIEKRNLTLTRGADTKKLQEIISKNIIYELNMKQRVLFYFLSKLICKRKKNRENEILTENQLRIALGCWSRMAAQRTHASLTWIAAKLFKSNPLDKAKCDFNLYKF